MASATLDLAGLLEGIPVGSWVAISEARSTVLCFGPSAVDVANQAKEMGEEVPLIVRVRDPDFFPMFL